MDLDVTGKLEPYALRDKMSRVLSGPALGAALRASGLEMGAVSAPKQTDTTESWKVALSAGSTRTPLHTKIELSRREATEEAVLEAVDANVVGAHQVLPLLVRHYPADAALRQKVRALVGRAVVQARDVFDLWVLLSRTGGGAAALAGEKPIVERAIERAMDVSFDDFRGQVVAFLDPAHADTVGTRQAWDALTSQVVSLLEKAAR
jgi:hypothetical protein